MVSGVKIVVNSDRAFRPKALTFDGQYTALIVAQQDPLLAVTFQQCLGLGNIKVNLLLLITVDPRGQNHKEQLPGLQNEGHG